MSKKNSPAPLVTGTAANPFPSQAPATPATDTAAAPVVSGLNPSMFVLETGVPIPTKRPRGLPDNPMRDFFDKMEIGVSFFVPATEADPDPGEKMNGIVSRMSKTLFPKKFTSFRQTTGDQKGVRVWRAPDLTERPVVKPRGPKKPATPAAE